MQNLRVVLLSNHSLLAASVRSLLESAANFQFHTVATDESEISAKIRQKNPHVIIIDSGDASLGEDVITHLLGQHPSAKVIALNLNRRDINVYQVRRVVKSDLNGLMDAIRGRRQLSGKEFRQKKTKSADSPKGGEAVRI